MAENIFCPIKINDLYTCDSIGMPKIISGEEGRFDKTYVDYESPCQSITQLEQSFLKRHGIYPILDEAYYNPKHHLYWMRITFDTLDSISNCMGEKMPYESEDYHWLGEIKNSSWLGERHEYEYKHYKYSLKDFTHYIFHFHDNFIEAIAKGIWIEPACKAIFSPHHPFQGTSRDGWITKRELFKENIKGVILQNPAPLKTIVESAKLCNQILLELVIFKDINNGSPIELPEDAIRLFCRNKNGCVNITKWDEPYEGALDFEQLEASLVDCFEQL